MNSTQALLAGYGNEGNISGNKIVSFLCFFFFFDLLFFFFGSFLFWLVSFSFSFFFFTCFCFGKSSLFCDNEVKFQNASIKNILIDGSTNYGFDKRSKIDWELKVLICFLKRKKRGSFVAWMRKGTQLKNIRERTEKKNVLKFPVLIQSTNFLFFLAQRKIFGMSNYYWAQLLPKVKFGELQRELLFEISYTRKLLWLYRDSGNEKA